MPSAIRPLARFCAAALLALSAGRLAAVEIEDSRGVQNFETLPERPVALSWSLVEQLLELGVTPLAAADPEGYAKWVARPPIPEGVEGVGLRQEPNLERIAELEPDVILISDDQIDFAPTLERIAPVLHFDTFDEGHDNPEAARETFRMLARLFEREAAAEAKLDALDARLAGLRAEIGAAWDGVPPEVAVVRFSDASTLRVYGDNSMPQAALDALGLENAWPQPATRWGLTTKRVEELGQIEEGLVLHIEPFEQAEEVFSQPLWRAMPFVREGRFAALPATWTYGGAMSVGHLADVIADAVVGAAPE